MRVSLFFLAVLVTIVTADDVVVSSCDDCPPGPPGPKGEQGKRGPEGVPGDKGDMGKLYYRGGLGDCGKDPCPKGEKGNIGDFGLVGETGSNGPPGLMGPPGKRGDPGSPGSRGPPGSLNADVMYLPYKPGDDVGHVCYSFRKSCLVPGLRNGWRGWYREGQSGYMIYNKWMYFVTLSDCPCQYNKPSPPQPVKPSDCVRRGKCE